ncbi:hypothetical protein L2916_05765, partial [Streptococcus pneumoniae]|nr:hypothetical protein [Streptococcus pneumoniae]
MERLAKSLGIAYFTANQLEVKEGLLTGKLVGQIISPQVKKETLEKWRKKLKLSKERTVAIGDGVNNLLIDLFGNCKKCYTIFMETVYDKAQKLNSKNFKLLIGVKKETFQLMLEHLNSAYQIQHRKGGRPRSLPMEDQLIMTLRYLRYYPTQRL